MAITSQPCIDTRSPAEQTPLRPVHLGPFQDEVGAMKNIVMISALTVALGACGGGVKEDVGAPVEDRKPEVVTTAPPAPPAAVPAPPTVKRVDAEPVRADQ